MKKLLSAVLILGLAVPVMAADLSSNADFKAKCAGCHGPDGQKENKAMGITPLKGAASKSDADLTKVVTDGKGKMPAYKGKLTDDQIKGIVAAIKAQK